MQTNIGDLIGSIRDMPGAFEPVVTSDPVSAVLVVLGALLMAVTMGVGGYLLLGAVADLFTTDRSGPSPPREVR